MNDKVIVLMATYNGSKFLKEQIESIQYQTHLNWELWIRDDNSSDSTVEIIRNYESSDSRIRLVEDSSGNLGVSKNFLKLLSLAVLSEANYFCFSDQDDVWIPDKIEKQLSFMKEKECSKRAVLVHSDLEVVDEKLAMINLSFMSFLNIHHVDNNAISVLLTQNFVTGCTMMMNRELIEVALPVSNQVVIHDWWLALCASAVGEVVYINQAMVKYRQHGSNEVGVRSYVVLLNPFSKSWLTALRKNRMQLLTSMLQAKELLERVKHLNINNSIVRKIAAYAYILEVPPSKRLKEIRRNAFSKQTFMRQFLFKLNLLTL